MSATQIEHQQSSAAANNGRIPTLDGWRCIAIVGVLIAHATPPGSPIWYLRPLGQHGVHLFFVISGFLITSRLLEEQSRDGGIRLDEFYLRRAFRILPPAFVFLAIIFLLGTTGVLQQISAQETLIDGLFLQNYLGIFPGHSPHTGHFWSLAVEEHFYLLFPLLLTIAGAKRLRWQIPAFCALAAGWRVIDDLFIGGHVEVGYPNHRTDRIFDMLLLGCLLAILVGEKSVRDRLRAFLTPGLIFTCALLYAINIYRPVPIFNVTIEALLASLMIAGTVLSDSAIPGRILESAPLRAIGRISYSLYLWQQPFLVSSYRPPASWLQHFPVNLMVSVACAVLSYLCLEKPLLAFGRRYILRRRAQVQSLVATS